MPLRCCSPACLLDRFPLDRRRVSAPASPLAVAAVAVATAAAATAVASPIAATAPSLLAAATAAAVALPSPRPARSARRVVALCRPQNKMYEVRIKL